VIRALLHVLLYLPSRAIEQTPEQAGLRHRELELDTEDGERLQGWWVDAQSARAGHVLRCHGKAGNIGDRVVHSPCSPPWESTCCCSTTAATCAAAGSRASTTPMATPAPRSHAFCLSLTSTSRHLRVARRRRGLDLALAHPPVGLVLLSAFVACRRWRACTTADRRAARPGLPEPASHPRSGITADRADLDR
jgi:hypothetical protein